MTTAFRVASEFSDNVLVEQKLEGRNYRVLIVNNRLVAASERIPCRVIGDGKHSIQELVDIENQNTLRGEGHEKPLTKIKIDQAVVAHLHASGRTLASVPTYGEEITLSERINLSVGATARDVTDEVHPTIARMCERAARVAGIDVCGVDLIARDIAEPILDGGIIELNAGPGLRMHHFPSEGKPRDAGGAIVDMLFPDGKTGRIPIISITGTNGKTTVTRLIAQMLKERGQFVGMTSTDGIFIDGECVAKGDMTGPHSAQVVLSDPAVGVAVLETARGGIVRRGLGYDWSDIGVMTNIGGDHVGQDGIKSIDDIVFIKSLVAERVKEGGTLILNADDEHLCRLRHEKAITRVKKTFVYFSLNRNSSIIRSHLRVGGTAYVLDDGWLLELTKDACERIVHVNELAIAMDGAAEFQVANVLAAIAACRAYGVSIRDLKDSLTAFNSSTHNPGRANLYKLNGGYLMVDYGHNSGAFEAICRMASRWNNRRVTGVIGVPGDRDDTVVKEAAQVAARGFHRLIVKEDADLRGRPQGNIAEILCTAVQDESPGTPCEVILDEAAAVSHAVKTMDKGEIVIVFYDQLAPIQKLLDQFSAEPIATLPPLDGSSSDKRRSSFSSRRKDTSHIQAFA